MRVCTRLIALTAILTLLGLLSPAEAQVRYAAWQRQDEVNQWDGWDPMCEPDPDDCLDPLPRWGTEWQLYVPSPVWWDGYSGYLWVETTWLDQQLVPPTAPAVTVGGDPIPGYPYRASGGASWIYAWEFRDQPPDATVIFPNSDYFHLENGLESVEVSSLYGIETSLDWYRDTTVDAWNRSDVPANAFHVELNGIDSRSLNFDGHYSDDYSWPPNKQDTDTGCEVIFEGVSTESGASTRFGLPFGRVGLTDEISGTMRWTHYGTTIATLPDVWTNYYQVPGEGLDPWGFGMFGGVDARLTNRSSSDTVWIQRSVNLDLDDPWEPQWDEVTLVDPDPVRLQPGETLLHRFDADPWAWWGQAAMMYDVFEDDAGQPGQLLATFYDAVVLVPEPAGLTLLLLGGLSLGGLALIRRRVGGTQRS